MLLKFKKKALTCLTGKHEYYNINNHHSSVLNKLRNKYKTHFNKTYHLCHNKTNPLKTKYLFC